MAFRYRQLYPGTGDVLDTRDWNLNHKELAEEFNGYLDRDNLPEAVITTPMVVENTFVKVHGDSEDDDVGTWVSLDVGTIGWQTEDGTNEIGSAEFFSPSDCLLICDFSATFHTVNNWREDFIRFRITVDGDVVGLNGPQSMSHVSMSMYVNGAVPVLAGFHIVKAEAQIGAIDGLSQGYRKVDVVTNAYVGARELVVIERRR
jgi:hypothetical protein